MRSTIMKSITTLAVVLFVATASTADAALLGAWRFENNLNDASGNNRPMSPAPKVYGGGLIGSALDINGVVSQTVEQGATTAGPGIDDNVFDFAGGDFTVSLSGRRAPYGLDQRSAQRPGKNLQLESRLSAKSQR